MHRAIWPLALAVLIFAASSRSQVAGPDVVGVDKVTHFGLYGLLATLTIRVARPSWRNAGWTLVAVSLYGLSDEWHQSFTPGRFVELADWVADTLGAAAALSLYVGWPAYRAVLEIPLKLQRRIEKPASLAPSSAR